MNLSSIGQWALWVGPVLGTVAAAVSMSAGYGSDMAIVGFVAVLCVIWWIFEPVPIPVTSLLPLAILPLLGVLSPSEVGEAYGSPLILLLLGGFLLSKAMEHSGAHRRIALGMVALFGVSSGRRLVMGFMAAAAVLSMWISNTATALMLLPVALAVLDAADDLLCVDLGGGRIIKKKNEQTSKTVGPERSSVKRTVRHDAQSQRSLDEHQHIPHVP